MTIEPSTIYWIGQCDCIRAVCGPITVIGFLLFGFSIFLTIGCFLDKSIPRPLFWMGVMCSSSFSVAFIIGILGQVFVPTSKTVASMYVIPAIANNEKVKEAGNQIYALAVEWMEELRPESKKKTVSR